MTGTLRNIFRFCVYKNPFFFISSLYGTDKNKPGNIPNIVLQHFSSLKKATKNKVSTQKNYERHSFKVQAEVSNALNN